MLNKLQEPQGRSSVLVGLILVGLFLVPTNAISQSVDGKRLIRSWTAPVKVDGGEAEYRFDIYYDYATGQAEEFIFAEDNSLVKHKLMKGQPSLNKDEVNELIAIVNADSEFSNLITANDAEALGGFIWTDEEGMACAYPGSRCAQVDIMTKTRDRRIRYVVVDLMKSAIVYRDFQPDNPDLQ